MMSTFSLQVAAQIPIMIVPESIDLLRSWVKGQSHNVRKSYDFDSSLKLNL